VTIVMTRGLSFVYNLVTRGTVAHAVLTSEVRVTHSNVASCPAGQTGTLTIGTGPNTASLNLCGSLFHHHTRAIVTVEEN
jgi:hypothetical protein